MKQGIWWVVFALLLAAGGWLFWKQKQAAATSTDDGGDTTGTGSTKTNPTKVLGSDVTTAFAAGKSLYANTAVRVRSGPGLTNIAVKTAKTGELIGTTTGTETVADALTWVKATQGTSTIYVAKNYTYILQ